MNFIKNINQPQLHRPRNTRTTLAEAVKIHTYPVVKGVYLPDTQSAIAAIADKIKQQKQK